MCANYVSKIIVASLTVERYLAVCNFYRLVQFFHDWNGVSFSLSSCVWLVLSPPFHLILVLIGKLFGGYLFISILLFCCLLSLCYYPLEIAYSLSITWQYLFYWFFHLFSDCFTYQPIASAFNQRVF